MQLKELALTFVPGVEISTMWGGSCIHVVGLDIQFKNPKLKEALLQIQKEDFKETEQINLALIKAGLPSMLERALSISGGEGQIGRVHFARAMVEKIFVKMSAMFFLLSSQRKTRLC